MRSLSASVIVVACNSAPLEKLSATGSADSPVVLHRFEADGFAMQVWRDPTTRSDTLYIPSLKKALNATVYEHYAPPSWGGTFIKFVDLPTTSSTLVTPDTVFADVLDQLGEEGCEHADPSPVGKGGIEVWCQTPDHQVGVVRAFLGGHRLYEIKMAMNHPPASEQTKMLESFQVSN